MNPVTVVIPFQEGNNEEWLAEAVKSVGDYPVVVARNDGDLCGALNAAIRGADSEFVFRLDYDDHAGPDLLAKLLAFGEERDVVYPSMVLTDVEMKMLPAGLHMADPFSQARLECWNFITSAALVRRSKFLEVGGYRDLLALEDWDLWVRMARAGARFQPVPDAWIFYRQVPGSRNRLSPELGDQLAREIRGDDPAADLTCTFYHQATPINVHLRCQAPARHLGGGLWSINLIPVGVVSDDPPQYQFPFQRGPAVFQFPGSRTDWLTIRYMRQAGHPAFVETDDNYTTHAGGFMRNAGWVRRIGEETADRVHSVEGHLKIVRDADGVIVTNEYLRGIYRQHNRNVWVCPNQVEPGDWPPLSKPDDGVFRVGWFASHSHGKDAKLVAPGLKWASEQPGVEVVVMGLRPGWRFPYTHIPWSDNWLDYRRNLQLLDVGVAPVVDTKFSLGRSDLKALDYAMGAAAPILQKNSVYEAWGPDTCLKAKLTADFTERIKYAVKHRDEMRQLGLAAREHVLANRTYEANKHLWQEALDSVAVPA